MNFFLKQALLIAALAATGAAAAASQASAMTQAPLPNPAQLTHLQANYTELARQLGTLCPIAAPGDQAAFDRCRHLLYGDSLLRRRLPAILLWGRYRGLPINETPLTQFAPDVYIGLYAPLFMFAGTAQVEFDAGEKLYKATLPVSFRNRLAPGQFPYPFWHDKTKWSSYQSAIAIVFFIDPKTEKIRVGQFVPGAVGDELATQAAAQEAAFDGKWLWTDAAGKTQPQVTLFDGLYSRENPYLPKIETSYKALALELRAGQCDSCHAPDNPRKIRRLVPMQTPAHAAGEIKRILRAVRDGSMPHDEFGIEKPLDESIKLKLLSQAETFDRALTSAKVWEDKHPLKRP